MTKFIKSKIREVLVGLVVVVLGAFLLRFLGFEDPKNPEGKIGPAIYNSSVNTLSNDPLVLQEAYVDSAWTFKPRFWVFQPNERKRIVRLLVLKRGVGQEICEFRYEGLERGKVRVRGIMGKNEGWGDKEYLDEERVVITQGSNDVARQFTIVESVKISQLRVKVDCDKHDTVWQSIILEPNLSDWYSR